MRCGSHSGRSALTTSSSCSAWKGASPAGPSIAVPVVQQDDSVLCQHRTSHCWTRVWRMPQTHCCFQVQYVSHTFLFHTNQCSISGCHKTAYPEPVAARVQPACPRRPAAGLAMAPPPATSGCQGSAGSRPGSAHRGHVRCLTRDLQIVYATRLWHLMLKVLQNWPTHPQAATRCNLSRPLAVYCETAACLSCLGKCAQMCRSLTSGFKIYLPHRQIRKAQTRSRGLPACGLGPGSRRCCPSHTC